jgi:4-hydroxyphenylpyruvate dioxygenase
VGEGERHIPAVRAPDGTLIYLVEPDAGGRSIWQDDFHLIEDAPIQGSGLTCIDHIAQALPYGRMDSFVLFYLAVFGFKPEQLWELPDPYGLIRSRAVVSPDRSVRMPLNISESRKTATGRFISASAGAGVHHVAFATDDIMKTAMALSEARAPILPVPANYYDDLAARHGLDDAFLADLQSRDLLFDRDDQGDFFHSYTDSFEGRFFFEIVQRRGYQQFGAANASVRMAMQAQIRSDSELAAFLP